MPWPEVAKRREAALIAANKRISGGRAAWITMKKELAKPLSQQ